MPVSIEESQRREGESQEEIEATKEVLLEILQKDPSRLFTEEELRERFCKVMRARLSWWQKLTPGGLALNQDNIGVVLLVNKGLHQLLDEGQMQQPNKGWYGLRRS